MTSPANSSSKFAPTYAIRSMEADDLSQVMEIEHASFTAPWTLDTFKGLLRHPDVCLLAAVADGDIVYGYAAMWFAGREAKLGDLAVGSEYRRRGIGRSLLLAALKDAKARGTRSVFLEVRESNEVAVAMYEAQGFEVIGRRAGYYELPAEDALVMRFSFRSITTL